MAYQFFIQMNDVLRSFNLISIAFRLFLAILLGGCIGVERSRRGRAAGLRTHILVCLGSTIAAMTGIYINEFYGVGDVSRIAAQVISGIGFLGAGTILVRNHSIVTGLTTSACVWTVGSVGLAIGYGFYEAAVLGGLIVLFITKKLEGKDKFLQKESHELNLYIEFVNSKELNETLEEIKKTDVELEIFRLHKTKTNIETAIACELVVYYGKDRTPEEVLDKINGIENVNFSVPIV